MYRVTKIVEIEAAHELKDYVGACNRLHGHSYKIEVTIESKELDAYGMVLDFKELKNIIKQTIIDKYDHTYLNDTLMVDSNPTAECMAYLFYKAIEYEFESQFFKIKKVKVWETSTSFAEYEAD